MSFSSRHSAYVRLVQADARGLFDPRQLTLGKVLLTWLWSLASRHAAEGWGGLEAAAAECFVGALQALQRCQYTAAVGRWFTLVGDMITSGRCCVILCASCAAKAAFCCSPC